MQIACRRAWRGSTVTGNGMQTIRGAAGTAQASYRGKGMRRRTAPCCHPPQGSGGAADDGGCTATTRTTTTSKMKGRWLDRNRDGSQPTTSCSPCRCLRRESLACTGRR